MTERDGAAIHVDLRRVEAELAHDRERLDGERLVQFKQIDVLGSEAGPIERLANGGDRAHSHDRRVDADDRVRHDARQRRSSHGARLRAGGHDQRSGAVIDPGRIAGRHTSLFPVECRLQFGELLHRCPGAWIFVGVDAPELPFLLRDLDRHDLVSEAARLDRALCALLALCRESILILTRNLISGGDGLRGHAHVTVLDRAHQALGQDRINRFNVAHPIAPPRTGEKIGRVRHRLGPAGNDRIHVPHVNGLGRVDNRLQA